MSRVLRPGGWVSIEAQLNRWVLLIANDDLQCRTTLMD